MSPFTAKARRFFHAAAARGQKGMTALAGEADELTKQGKELPPVKAAHGGIIDVPVLGGEEYEEKTRGEPEHEETPEHVEKMASGGYACMHCGGEVDSDGASKSMHPELEDDGGGSESGQYESREDMRSNAFADAVSYSRHRRGQ